MTMTGLEITLFISLFLTAAVLAVGIIAMIRGGSFNKKYGTRLMRLRIVMQGLTLLIFAFVLIQRGG